MSRLPWELTDEQRWAEAESVLDRQPTPEARQRIRRQRRLVWLLVGGGVVVATVGLVILVLSHSPARPHQVPRHQETAGLLVQLLGLVVTFTALVRQVRSDNWRERWTLPTTALTWRQRRELLAQLRARRPVDPARLRLLHDLATRLANPRGQVLMAVGLGLTTAGQTVVHPNAVWFALDGVYAVLLVTSGPLVVRRQGQARRFLETYS